ncbi:hypothetical protein KUTeg_005170 [Tegillarca granosa]|uniref:Endothelin-converting enzyme 1 n=1 Tax=Tegillarca granosa TaxID=220873 RepID=A0ABQ9FKR1_TEGGR|nr:hypothetical protein KUTeg_005170 [Tegillarca granosa]
MGIMYGSHLGLEDIPEVVIVRPGHHRNIAAAESNELLNHNAIKMNDFERTDSEDDILEDYDGSDCEINLRCLRKRTVIEKCLFVFLVIMFIIIIALIIALATKKTTEGIKICQTQDCIESASSILQSMNLSTDPCKDFYQYACGRWMQNTPIPPGYQDWDRLQELAYTNLYQLRTLLEEKMTDESGMKAKKFYKSCMSESRQKREETLHDFHQLIYNISKDENNWDFGAVLEQIHKLNSWPIFKLVIGPDERNAKKNIIKIEFGEMGYPFGTSQETMVTTSRPDTSTSASNTTTLSTMTAYVPYTGTYYLKWNESQISNKYMEETSQILKVFWNVSDTDSVNLCKKLMNLEKSIGKARGSLDHVHNRSHVYNVMTVNTLQSKCAMLNWDLYLNAVTMDATGVVTKLNDELVVLHEDSLMRLCHTIIDYQKDSSKRRILRYYLIISYVRNIMPYFDIRTFKDIEPDEEIALEGEHWRRCVYYTNKALGFVTGAAYVHATSGIDSVRKVKELIKDVKLAFKDYLLRKVWITPETKQEAGYKIDEMLDKISYPDFILDGNFLTNLYKSFFVGDDWFNNVKQWQIFQVTSMVSTLSHPPDRKSWINPPVTVESDYSPVRNDIMFPIAMLHLPFYTQHGSQAFNFGAMGAVIGHEITHAFDILGRQYDGRGQLKDWWDQRTAHDFKITTDCMRDQYDRYKIQGLPVNGLQTLDENIADNGGLRASNIMFCSKWTYSGLVSHLIEDTHSPGPIRVKGSISNSDSFAEAFQCPFISDYSPQTKCQVW